MTFEKILCIGLVAFIVSCGERAGDQGSTVVEKGVNEASIQEAAKKKKNIIFFGNSLTAAYRLDPSQGYVSLLQMRLDSLGLPYKAINAGLSGETTAGGRERVEWVIRQPVDIFVLELGGNDALRGIEPKASYENLDAIITSVKAKYPGVLIVLAGMEAPPNLGQQYTAEFRAMYPSLAEKHSAALIPFFMENVGGIAELNLSDGIHPNEDGQKILAENVWRVLEPLLAQG